MGTLPSTGHTYASSYGHMVRRATVYRMSVGAQTVIFVPDPIFLEERTVGLCLKRGHTCINLSPQ
jgi:hypothetical protein